MELYRKVKRHGWWRRLAKRLLFYGPFLLCGIVFFRQIIRSNDGMADRKSEDSIQREHHLSTMYASHVKECSLTVVVMDPNLPYYPSNHAVFRMLESVADYTPADACVVLQTSVCIMEQYLCAKFDRRSMHVVRMNHTQGHKGSYEVQPSLKTTGLEGHCSAPDDALRAVADNIYERSKPLFQQRLLSGRVRLTVVNHVKYHLASCHNFYNPGYAWLSNRYYMDEFTLQDNDLMLFIEADAMLCRPLLVEHWRNRGVTYLGAPWASDGKVAREVFYNFHLGSKFRIQRGDFNGNRSVYKDRRVYWRKVAREEYHAQYNRSIWLDYWNSQKDSIYRPSPHLPFPAKHVYHDDKRRLVGNGGLSLRSRKWLLRALHTCPSPIYSPSITGSNCTLEEFINDDIFFSSMLNVIGPELSLQDALYFSTQNAPPDETTEEHLRALGGEDWVNDYKMQLKQHGKPFPLGYHQYTQRRGCPPKDVCKYACEDEA